ncbi:MAG: hypothetical protein ACLFSQ_05150 [Candidatus Zixiibacteriota bacterium]
MIITLFISLSFISALGVFGEPDYDSLEFHKIFIVITILTAIVNLVISIKYSHNIVISILIFLITAILFLVIAFHPGLTNDVRYQSYLFSTYGEKINCDNQEYLATLILKRINLSAEYYYSEFGAYPKKTDSIVKESQWQELEDVDLSYYFEIRTTMDSLTILAIPENLGPDTLIMKNGKMQNFDFELPKEILKYQKTRDDSK